MNKITAVIFLVLLQISCTPSLTEIMTQENDFILLTFAQIKKAAKIIDSGKLKVKELVPPEELKLFTALYNYEGYKGHNTIVLNYTFCKKFKSDYKNTVYIGFDIPLGFLAQAFVQKNQSYYVTRVEKLQTDIKALKDIQYLVVAKTDRLQRPRFSAKEKFFYYGSYTGTAHLFRLKDLKYYGSTTIQAKSSKKLKIEDRYYTYQKNTTGYHYNRYRKKYEHRTLSKTTTIDRGSLQMRGQKAADEDLATQIDHAIKKTIPRTSDAGIKM